MTLGLTRLAFALTVCAAAQLSATGETPEAPADACPTTTLSVYFPSADASVPAEARALIGKLRDTAASCRPDRIDLTPRFDPRASDPEGALAARSRLALVVNSLVDAGISASTIHVATAPAHETADGDSLSADRRLHIIDVQFNAVAPVSSPRPSGGYAGAAIPA
jgi:hypothetical protein